MLKAVQLIGSGVIKEKNYISINYNYSMAHYFRFIKGKKRIKTNNNYIKSKKK